MIPIVINLDHRKDRLKLMYETWKPHFKSITRFSGLVSNIRHKGASLSHVYATLNYFQKNIDQDYVLIFEDDSIPTKSLNNFEEIIKQLILVNDTWETIILSPLLSPGYLNIEKVNSLYYLKNGYHLSTSAVIYNRRIISFFNELKLYYENDSMSYMGIDKKLSFRGKKTLFLTNYIHQNYELKSDNPNPYSKELCNLTQLVSNNIFFQLKNDSKYINYLVGFIILNEEFMDNVMFITTFYIFMVALHVFIRSHLQKVLLNLL